MKAPLRRAVHDVITRRRSRRATTERLRINGTGFGTGGVPPGPEIGPRSKIRNSSKDSS